MSSNNVCLKGNKDKRAIANPQLNKLVRGIDIFKTLFFNHLILIDN